MVLAQIGIRRNDLKHILTPLFETKTILSLFNNHYYYYYYMAKATFGRITQYIRQFVERLLA